VKLNKLDELGRYETLSFGVILGIISFIFLLQPKTAHPVIGSEINELLIFLSFLAIVGGNAGFAFHFSENRGKFSNARFDLKAITTLFFAVYFPMVIAILTSSSWLIFPKIVYYSYFALSFLGGLLFGSLIAIGSRRMIGIIKKIKKEEN